MNINLTPEGDIPPPEIGTAFQLRQELDQAEAKYDHLRHLAASLQDKIDQLRLALLVYGDHRSSCVSIRDRAARCTCGYTDLIKP
jgi:acetone carboxylase gamma subunit